MLARDIMSTRVVTVDEDTTVGEIAAYLNEFRISAVPVVDAENRVVGMVSEGDLMRRAETGTDRRRHSWWLTLLVDRPDLAREYVKSHGTRARDIMTRDVITVDEETPLNEIAEILEKNQIKRVPVLRNGALVGLVSRANIVQQLASGRKIPVSVSRDDGAVRDAVEAALEAQPWASSRTTSVTVHDGAVELWGFVSSDEERQATRVALDDVSGIKSLADHRSLRTGVETGAY